MWHGIGHRRVRRCGQTVEVLHLENRLLFSASLAVEEMLAPLATTAVITSPAPLLAATTGLGLDLHSRPDATAKLYLDFTGDVTNSWGTFAPGATPAYDTDGNPAVFSDAEVASIRDIWARVADQYSPFNLDVTTVDPGNLMPGQTLKIVVGGDGAWYGTVGGVCFPGSFSAGYGSNTGFVFSSHYSSDETLARAIAHEAGHGFGLQHQSIWDSTGLVNEYNSGDALTAPIMGISYYAERGLWWSGTNLLGQSQDDMAVIASEINGFGYAADDFGDSIDSAASLGASSLVSINGTINHETDRDLFAFTAPGGNVAFNLSSRMLMPAMDLMDANGNILASADSRDFSASLSADLPAGKYYIAVHGHGSYGDVGQYTLRGLLPDAGGPYIVAEGSSTILSASGSDPSLIYSWDLNGDGIADAAGTTVKFNAVNGPGPLGVTLQVTDPITGTSTTNSATVNIIAAHWAKVIEHTADRPSADQILDNAMPWNDGQNVFADGDLIEL